jgi:CheY-like chemotaxis protein
MSTTMPKKYDGVLVVDDDPGIRDLLVDILDFDGYAVETARDGGEALAKLESGQSYLVFLDLLMPVLDGREFCHILNAQPALRSRHSIILMSALNALTDVQLLNVDALLPKPFEVEDVIRALEPFQ